MGTSDMEVKIWFNETLLIHLDNYNATNTLHNKSYSRFAWNSYANANQGLGETPTTGTGFRYEDNIHVRNGSPVSCSTIGFSSIDTWTINTFSLVSPSVCTQGSCSDPADVSATASGTCTDTIDWGIDCDTSGGYVEENTLAACNNSSGCSVANVCDYSAKAPATYTAEIRSTCGAVPTDTQTTTFTVLPSSVIIPGNIKRGGTILRGSLDILNLLENPYAIAEGR
jgi:hypothetical protein